MFICVYCVHIVYSASVNSAVRFIRVHNSVHTTSLVIRLIAHLTVKSAMSAASRVFHPKLFICMMPFVLLAAADGWENPYSLGPTLWNDIHTKKGQTLVLSPPTNSSSAVLCPDGPSRCSFADNSTIVLLRAGSLFSGINDDGTSIFIGGGGLRIPDIIIGSGVKVTLSKLSANAPSSELTWTFANIKLSYNSTMKISGYGARAITSTLHFSPYQNASEFPIRHHLSIKRTNLFIASGAKLVVADFSTPTRIPDFCSVHLVRSSMLHIRGGLLVEKGSQFVWTLGMENEKRDRIGSTISGSIFVEGNVLVNGGDAIILQDKKYPVTLVDGVDIVVSSLMSAAEFSGRLDAIVLGNQVQCANASVSESWSSLSVLVSCKCLHQCSLSPHKSCSPDSTPISSPSQLSQVNDNDNSDAVGVRSRYRWLYTGVIAMCIIGSLVLILLLIGRAWKTDFCSSGSNMIMFEGHPGIVRRHEQRITNDENVDDEETDTALLIQMPT